jgi:dipeptidyl aminopeptidase/acylaminoacyl peptidase
MAFTRMLVDHDILRFEVGRPHGLFLESSFYDGTVSFSPDGRRIAFDCRDDAGRWDIWTIGVEGGPPLRLTHHPGDENVPSWSRDGRWVYYGSEREGAPGIFRVPAEGGAEERLTRTAVWGGAKESVDGRTLFYKRGPGATPLVAHSLAGGPEETLVQCVDGMPGFVVAENGIYYVPCSNGNAMLHRLDPGSRRDVVLGKLDRYGFLVFASPKGDTVLYQRLARMTADVVLIENYR